MAASFSRHPASTMNYFPRFYLSTRTLVSVVSKTHKILNYKLFTTDKKLGTTIEVVVKRHGVPTMS
jgi:hypothetical protein